jgi:hypothetical protein
MQDQVFPFNLALKYVRLSLIGVSSTETNCAKPDHHKLDHAEPNEGLQCQIIMQDLHSPEINMQYRVVIPHGHFGTTSMSQLQESRNPEERT